MSIDEIRTLKHAQPFRPIKIVTKQGQTLRIDLPIRIALAPNGESVAGFTHDGAFFLMLSEVANANETRKKGGATAEAAR